MADASALVSEAPPPPSEALPFVLSGLQARALCVCAAVCRAWRAAASAELARALRLDGEPEGGRALRSLLAASARAAGAPPRLELLSLVRCAALHAAAATVSSLLTKRAGVYAWRERR